MDRLVSTWNRFWFVPQRPHALALCRFLYLGGVAWVFRGVDNTGWTAFSDSLWFPTELFDLVGLMRPTSIQIVDWVDSAFLVALLLGCLGIFTRFSIASAFVLGLFVLGVGNNFGKVNHGDNMAIWTIGVLALSRCGDALSVDSWWRRRRGGGPRSADGEYTWPIRAVWLLLVAMYCSAGISKLAHTGVAWSLSDNLQNLLVRHHYTHAPPTDWGLWIAGFPEVCVVLAIGALLLELSCPVALFDRRLRVLIGFSLFGLQAGIWILMGVSFITTLMLVVFWIPWNELLDLVRPPIRTGSA